MRSFFVLEPRQLAEHYVNAKGGARRLPMTDKSLVADIQKYLCDRGMRHRLEDVADIADAAVALARAEVAQEVPTPEQTAWSNDQAQGISDPDAELAQYMAGLDARSYAAEREKLIGRQGTLAFLSGNTNEF